MAQAPPIEFPPFHLDVANEQLWRRTEQIHLRPKTFAALRYLVEHSEQLVTKETLFKLLWPGTYSSFQLHASSSVGAILVIAQWGRGAGRIQDSPLLDFRSHPSEIRYM